MRDGARNPAAAALRRGRSAASPRIGPCTMLRLGHKTEGLREVPTATETRGAPQLLPDVLVPQLRVLANEAGHHLDALGVVEVNDFDALLAEEVGAAVEVDGLAGDHFRDAELDDRAAAQEAGHQG